MRTTTERDLDAGVTTVRLYGELTRTTVTTVRAAIGKAAAECPTAVLVDLSGLSPESSAGLTVFAAATYQAQQMWGVPVLLYAAPPQIRGNLRGFRGFVALYEDRWQAATAVRAYLPRWVRQHLPASPSSPATARALVSDACLIWRLPQLRDGARLVISELVSNAVQHAGTDLDVTAAYTGRYLRIAVQDGTRTVPRPIDAVPVRSAIMPAGSGRGLRAVDAFSTHWGVTRLPDGKIVWALMNPHAE